MAETGDLRRLSSPQIFLVRIVVFLILVGFIALILYKTIAKAFLANPGLNALIFFVLFIGIVFGLRNVFRLFGRSAGSTRCRRAMRPTSSHRSCWRRWRRYWATSRPPPAFRR